MRFTLDSNILVRAVASPHGPALRLLNIILGAHTLVLSRFILDEIERVLLYPRLQARYQITPNEATRFTGNLADAAHMVEPVIVEPVILSDPADDAVLTQPRMGRQTFFAPEMSGTSPRSGSGSFVRRVASAS